MTLLHGGSRLISPAPAVVVTPPVVTPGNGGTGLFPTGPGGGSVGDIGVIVQGQSNAIFFVDSYDAPGGYMPVYRYMDNMRALLGLTQQQSVDQYARSDFTSDATLYSGSATYHNATGGDPKWLDPVGHTLSDPTTWANTDIMEGFLNFCRAKQGTIGATRPWMLIRMHNEYDSRLGSEISVYEAANKEFIRRWRAVMGSRSVALLPVALCGVAYDSGTNGTALRTIRNAWRNLALDNSQNVFIGHGSALDAVDRSDGSHWDVDSAMRVARRMAITSARRWYDNSYTANDLSWLPRLGPTITGMERVAGQTNRLDFIVTHDQGNDLIAPTGTQNFGDYVVTDNGTQVAVTALVRQSANTIRATMASAISTTGTVTLDYGARTPFNGPNSQWSDNWHLIAKPPLAATIADLNNVRMILNRYGGVVTLGSSTAPPQVDPATQTFSISPDNPGTRDAGPQTLTITSTNISSMSWTRVGPAPNYKFLGGDIDQVDSWTDTPTTGSLPIVARWTETGQLVKYWPTGNIQAFKDTFPVTINPGASVPAAPGSDRAFAHDFVKNLTIGVNLERNNTGFVTTAWCADLIAAGCTHVRLFPFSNASLGFMSSDQLQGHYSAISTILAAGLKVIFDFQDVSSIADLNNSGTQPYITRVCADITAKNWDLARIAYGHTNEMANAGNSTFNSANNILLNLMREKLPSGALLIQGAGGWSSPDNLTDGTLTLGADKRRIYQWHTYEWDRSNIDAWSARRDQVKTWAAANGVETFNGEFSGFDPDFNDRAYDTYPAVIDAFARGAGNCAGTIWTVTDGTGWRLNVSGSNGALRSEVKTALTTANAYIRAQSYFNA